MTPLGSAKPFPLAAKNHHGGVLPVICRMLVCGKAVLPCRDFTCTSSAAKSHDVPVEIRSAQRFDVGLFTCVPEQQLQSARGQHAQLGKRVAHVADVFGGSAAGPTTVVRDELSGQS